MIVDRWVPPPSQGMLAWERRAASKSFSRNRERMAESDHSSYESSRKKKKVLVAVRSELWKGASVAEDSDEEVIPSPNIRIVFNQVLGATTFDPRRRCFRHQRIREST